MKKYFLFLAMGALLALSANKMSAQTIIAQGTTGSLTWVLTDDSVMTINGSGAMPNYDENIPPWDNFYEGIKSIIIGNSVTTIGSSAFSNCSSLTSVTIPNSVTTIGNGTFSDCSRLTSVTIPNSVTTIGSWAFSGCNNLTSITIPNSVTTIKGAAFACCYRLTTIDVAVDNPNYSAVDGVLFNKNQTTLIQCPAVKSGAYTIPNSVTTIGSSAFACCSSLTSVTIPNSVTTIGSTAFVACLSLTSITIPDSVITIESSAFASCFSLTSITIPNSVMTIGDNAFAYCSSLAEIINFNPTPIGIDADVFLNVNIPTCILKVPTGSLSAYRAADVWKDFLNIEEISVSIAETEHTAPLQIYPNPATDMLHIAVPSSENVQIFDVWGRMVETRFIASPQTNGTVTINVSHLASGVYFVKIGNTTRKLNVNK
jgi:Flp pilus assembly protein protease CpaA